KYEVAAVELKENKTADAMRVRVMCIFIIISVSWFEVFWVQQRYDTTVPLKIYWFFLCVITRVITVY
ncbi:TPA: hypothetical protein ACH47H_005100, partial [Escherichia coli]